MRLFHGAPPCTVKLILEGWRRPSATCRPPSPVAPDLFQADLFVICNTGDLRTGEPVLTTVLPVDVACVVRVRTLEHPLHSGVFGGPGPDAMIALARLLATPHDENGDVAIDGVTATSWDGSDTSKDESAIAAS